MSFSLEVVGVVAKRAELSVFIEDVSDLGDLWDEYGRILSAFEAEWFATAGEGTWPALADSTARDKLRDGWPADPLIRTGALVESLTNPAEAMDVSQGRSTLQTFTRSAMTWGTSVTDDRDREYAHYHQGVDGDSGELGVDGESRWAPHPPQRMVIPWPLPPDLQGRFAVADEDFVADCVRRSGLA